MKTKISTFILCLLVAQVTFCQHLSFSNQNLKNHLFNDNTVDVDGDGFADSLMNLNNDSEIQVSEALAVENLNIGTVNGLEISSIIDLHQFSNLKMLTIYGGIGLTEISNLGLSNLEFIRVTDHYTITDIDLSDLPNLTSIIIEGLIGLNNLNLQNGSFASDHFSLFYTYFNFGCVDDIQEEYDIVAQHIIEGGNVTVNCGLDIEAEQKTATIIYPNPVLEEIKIKTDLAIAKCTLYDAMGKMVHEVSNPQENINVAHLEKGFYILLIKLHNGVEQYERIIKK